MKKLPTDQELLDQLSDAELDQAEHASEFDGCHSNIIVFIKKLEFSHGEHKVNARVLYKVYKLNTVAPLSFPVFVSTMKFYFETVKISKTTFFYLNKEVLDLAAIYTKPSPRKSKLLTRNAIELVTLFERAGIKAGSNWIEGRILYEAYKKLKNNKGKYMTYYTFNGLLKKMYPHKYGTARQCDWFSIDEAIRTILSDSEIRRFRSSRREYKYKPSLERKNTSSKDKEGLV